MGLTVRQKTALIFELKGDQAMPENQELIAALEAVLQRLMEQESSTNPLPHGGERFLDLNLPGLFFYLAEMFEAQPGEGAQAAFTVLGMGASKAAEDLILPQAQLARGLAAYFQSLAGELNNTPWDGLNWGGFFEGMARQALAHTELGAFDFGDFFRVIADAILLHLRPGSHVIRSGYDPPGLRKPTTLYTVLGNVQSLTYALGHWYGAYSTPRPELEDSGPIDWGNLPYSIPH